MTVLFSLSWLGSNGERLERHLRWFRYYTHPKCPVKFDRMIIYDDGSPAEPLSQWKAEVKGKASLVENAHLGRFSMYVMPYQWRAVAYVKTLLPVVDRVLWIENDFYVVSDRMGQQLSSVDGYVSPWCKMHLMPESGCSSISGFGKNVFWGWGLPHWKCESVFEKCAPFTGHLDLNGDRWAEAGDEPPYGPEIDYYAQATEKSPIPNL